MNVYQENGCSDRAEYLMFLAADFDIDLSTVEMLADLLGENEDFDGLVTSLEDAAEGMDF
jgi:hypothetical protein